MVYKVRLEDVITLDRRPGEEGIIGGVYDLYTPFGLDQCTNREDIGLVYHNAVKLLEQANKTLENELRECSRIINCGREILGDEELKARYDQAYTSKSYRLEPIPNFEQLGFFVVNHAEDGGVIRLAREYLESQILVIEKDRRSLLETTGFCVRENAVELRDNVFWLLDRARWKGKKGIHWIGGVCAGIAYLGLLLAPCGMFGGYPLVRQERYFNGRNVNARSLAGSFVASAISVPACMYAYQNGMGWTSYLLGFITNATAAVYGLVKNVHEDYNDRKDAAIKRLNNQLALLNSSHSVAANVNPRIAESIRCLASRSDPEEIDKHDPPGNNQTNI